MNATQIKASFAAVAFVLGGASVMPNVAIAECRTSVASVSGANPTVYSPFATADLNAPFLLEVSGPASSTVYARIAQEASSSQILSVKVIGRSGSGETIILSSSAGSFPANAATVARWWSPIALDSAGRGTLDLTLLVDADQSISAGDWPAALALRIACSDGVAGFNEQSSVVFATRKIRVLPEIGAASVDKPVIDLGVIPTGNPDLWNNGQSAALIVRATAPFHVRLVNQELLLRHAGSAVIGSATSIPYDLMVENIVLSGRTGGRRAVACWRPVSSGSLQSRLELKPLLPANATAGRLAGRYRDEITLSIEPLELATPDGAGGGCQ